MNLMNFYSQPCSPNYTGPSYFSEAETQAVRDVIANYNSRLSMYLSIQAYGQQITFPYNAITIPSDRQSQFISVATAASQAMQNSPAGRFYQIGAGGSLNGVEAGTSLDYANSVHTNLLPFTVRLPSGGSNGWDVPESQIGGILNEAFNGFLVFARYVATN